MKKLLTWGFVLIIVFSLVACGGTTDEDEQNPADTGSTVEDNGTDNNENQEDNDAEEDLSGTTITVGLWGGNDAETASFNQLLSEFTQATGIEVEERVYSDYNQELQAELIGGTAPDVFYVDAYMAPFYIQQEVLLPLDADEMEISAFYQPLADAFKMDDQYYAVSKDYSTLALYYNKKWVDEADIPETLEELLEGDFLDELNATLPEDVIAMTYNQDLARNMFIAQAGGADITRDGIYANLADETVENNLSILYNAAVEEKIKTPSDLGLGWNGDAFGNEKTAIMLEGNWTLGFLETNFPEVDFGVIEIPTFKGEKGTMVFTVGYAVNAMTKEEAAAKAFVKFATGTQGMATWTLGAGVLPSREDVTLATDVASDPFKKAHIEGANYATPWQKGTTMDTINNEYRNYIPSVVAGERTLSEALSAAEEEANSIIEANQ